MAWHRPGDKPLSEPMVVRLPTHICITRPQWVKGVTMSHMLPNYPIKVTYPLQTMTHTAGYVYQYFESPQNVKNQGDFIDMCVCVISAWSNTNVNSIFLHTTPWIPGGGKSIFIVVIEYWISTLHQFACARIINKYDITIPVCLVCVTSQVNCGDVTMLG